MNRKETKVKDYLYLHKDNLITSIKQKLIGIGLLVMTYLILKYGWAYDQMIGYNDATFALVTVPLGMYFIFTKNRII